MAGSKQITLDCASNRSGQRGLTLIELLVVMTILALAATIVIVNAPPTRSPSRTAADEFAQTLRGAVDLAIINGENYRIEVLPGAWTLAKLTDGVWSSVAATPEDDVGEVLLRIDVEDAAQSNALGLYGKRPDRRGRDEPVLVPIDPFGDTYSFALSFQYNRDVWIVRSADDGTIEVAQE